jgi:ABC-2 type transport system permease protein
MSLHYFTRVFSKGIWRDLKTFTRYRARVFGILFNLIVQIFGVFILGSAYNFSTATVALSGLDESAVFLFMASGVALQLFSGVATWAPLNRVENDIYYGTLEAVFVSPASRMAYLLATTASEAIITSIFFIPAYIFFLALIGKISNLIVIGYTLLIVIITIVSLTAFGMLFAMVAMIFRQTRALINVLHQLMLFLCGAYVPVQAFLSLHPVGGTILKYFVMIFPYTYCYDLMRFYLIGGNYITLLPVWMEYCFIIGGTILFLILAKFLLIAAEKKAKRSGLSIL